MSFHALRRAVPSLGLRVLGGIRQPALHYRPEIRTFVRSSQARTKFVQWMNTRADTVKEILLYSPVQVALGICIGGVGCTIAAIAFLLNYHQVIVFEDVLDKIKTRGDDGSKTIDVVTSSRSSMPQFPYMTLIGWTVLSVVTGAFAWARAKVRLQRREFLRQVTFSLNYFEDSVLKFRTIHECSLSDIFPDNPAALSIVVKSALKHRTLDAIKFPRSEQGFIMNSLLNRISPIFAREYFMADQNIPIKKDWYIMLVVYNRNDTKMKKLRVLFIKESILHQLGQDLSQDTNTHKIAFKSDWIPQFEHPSHSDRWDVIKELALAHHQKSLNHHTQLRPDLQYSTHRIEVAVPAPPSVMTTQSEAA